MQIGYARVSTADQSVDSQITKLKQAGCDKIFSENKSGIALERSELNKMLAMLREGDIVVVTELSRLGRSLIHTLKLIEDFKGMGVHFKSLDLGVDTTTPAGELIMNVFAALAQYERKNILERAKAGILEARKQGKQLGRPKGFNKVRLEKVAHLSSKGLGSSEIAKLLDCSTRTVDRYKKIVKDLGIMAPKNKILQQSIFGTIDLIEN